MRDAWQYEWKWFWLGVVLFATGAWMGGFSGTSLLIAGAFSVLTGAVPD